MMIKQYHYQQQHQTIIGDNGNGDDYIHHKINNNNSTVKSVTHNLLHYELPKYAHWYENGTPCETQRMQHRHR